MGEKRWLLWVVVIVSAAGAGLGLLAALIFAVMALLNLEAALFSALALALGLGALVMLPGAWLAYCRLECRPEPHLALPGGAALGMLAFGGWAACLVLGALLGNTVLGGLFVVGAAILPGLYVWSVIVGRDRPAGLRSWAAMTSSLLGVMPLAFLAEVLVILVLIVGVGLRGAGDAQFAALLQQLSEQADAAQLDPALAEGFIADLLALPGVLNGTLIFLCIITPLIEELAKPLAVWLLARRIDPRQGFLFGLLGGLIFAVGENVNTLAVAAGGSGWVVLVFGRAGTSLLHMATAGLVGFGIATAFHKRRPLALLLSYAAAVILHGVWNFFGVAEGLAPLTDALLFQRLGSMGALALGLITIVNLAVLFGLSWWSRRPTPPVPLEPEKGETTLDGLVD